MAETLAKITGVPADPMTPSALDHAITAEHDAAETLTESAFLSRFNALVQKASRFMAPE